MSHRLSLLPTSLVKAVFRAERGVARGGMPNQRSRGLSASVVLSEQMPTSYDGGSPWSGFALDFGA